MTSPGLKRPLDFEMPPNTSGPSGTSPSVGPVANGNKRRCTNFTSQQGRGDNVMEHTSSSLKDPSSILTSLSEDIASMIKEEVQKAPQDNNHCNNESPLLTVHQTQTICEKLIKDREQKLREEYERILASKLAEQYEILTKPKSNYLDSYGDSRMPTAITTSTANSSINALAAAYTSLHRSASAASSSPNLPDLSTLAASLSANGHPNALTTSQLAFNLQQQATAAAIQAQHHRVSGNNCSIPSGPVLLASNLDEQLAIPEALFTLFGVFGDVIRVKILFNKKDNALIQMADANQAQVAQGYLDKQKVFGKVIRVTRSKHQLVQMPREGNQSDAGLTKDFTNNPLHRFKIPGSRNYQNIYPPSNTLHISNIPATTDESDIHKAFNEACGFDFLSFKFFPKDRKMALMKFNSIEHATIALIKMHNFQICEDNNLRVSFSKSCLQQ